MVDKIEKMSFVAAFLAMRLRELVAKSTNVI
jgi:hypothetical protein